MDQKLLASEDANIQKTLLRQLSIMFQLNTIGEQILSKRHYNAKSKKKKKEQIYRFCENALLTVKKDIKFFRKVVITQKSLVTHFFPAFLKGIRMHFQSITIRTVPFKRRSLSQNRRNIYNAFQNAVF